MEIAEILRRKKNKSAFIAKTLREEFAKEDKEKKRHTLEQAYLSANVEEQSLNKEWESTVGDGM
jgi:hypothetical protein